MEEVKTNPANNTPEKKHDEVELNTTKENVILNQKIKEQENIIQSLQKSMEQQRKATMQLDESMRTLVDQNIKLSPELQPEEPYVLRQITKEINK